MDREGLNRLRWRLRGAWMWPTFLAVTLAEALIMHALPPSGQGAATLSSLIFVGFANLFLVAAVAPLAARALRRPRPDLPRMVAADYAGTALLAAGLVATLGAGLIHHGAIAARTREAGLAADAARAWVVRNAPAYHPRLDALSVHAMGAGLYRSCVPDAAGTQELCLFVDTAQSPPGITRDQSTQSNAELFRPTVGG